MNEHKDTIIITAGHAGPGMGCCLAQAEASAACLD